LHQHQFNKTNKNKSRKEGRKEGRNSLIKIIDFIYNVNLAIIKKITDSSI
jgi:hypothetical protein